MATFQDRLNAAIGGRGYSSMMRRSIQTVIVYEAHRCLEDKLPSLKVFQKKLAIFDQAVFLLNDSSLLPHEREEVMCKTLMSKELLDPEAMWKRLRKIVHALKKIAAMVKPMCGRNKSHLEVYNAFLQKSYVSARCFVGSTTCCFLLNLLLF
jgi:hypothetical protein